MNFIYDPPTMRRFSGRNFAWLASLGSVLDPHPHKEASAQPYPHHERTFATLFENGRFLSVETFPFNVN